VLNFVKNLFQPILDSTTALIIKTCSEYTAFAIIGSVSIIGITTNIISYINPIQYSDPFTQNDGYALITSKIDDDDFDEFFFSDSYEEDYTTAIQSLSHQEIFILRDQAIRAKLNGQTIPQYVADKLIEYSMIDDIESIDVSSLAFYPLIDISGTEFVSLSSATFDEANLPETYHYNDKKVVFQAAMETPVARVGGLGNFIKDFTRALNEKNSIDLSIISPFFDFLKDNHYNAAFVGYVDHEVWGKKMRSTIYKVRDQGITQFLIQPDPECISIFDIYKSNSVYSSYFHSELSARILYLNSAIAAMVANYRGENGQGHVDILHTHTWHTLISAIILNDSLNPLREEYGLPPIRILNTVHMHAEGEGFLNQDSLKHVGIKNLNPDSKYYKGVKYKGNLINILETGATYADATNTVSPSLAEDMLDSELSLKTHDTYRSLFQEGRFSGILNGMNQDAFNPQKRGVLGRFAVSADLSNLAEKKAKAKQTLYEANIISDPNKPLFLYVGRFGREKGTDLLGLIADRVTSLGGQMVIMGPGYDLALYEATKLEESGRAVKIYTDVAQDQLTTLKDSQTKKGMVIRFAADYTVLPSYAEACGLVGLEALSMGSFIATSNVQGLKSVCLPFDDDDNYEGENCVQFDILSQDREANALAMIDECFEREAKLSVEEKASIQKWLIKNAHSFDWNYSHETGSMEQYLKVYARLLGEEDTSISDDYKNYAKEKIEYFGTYYPNLQFAAKTLLMTPPNTMEYKKAVQSIEEAIEDSKSGRFYAISRWITRSNLYTSDLEEHYLEMVTVRMNETEAQRTL
tara:strand:+ start:51 stop:2471 length:2421 start_codon:yes stop_codon:yes gene_type:complete